MKVLLLGRVESPLRSYIEIAGDDVFWTDQKITEEFVINGSFDFLVSYNYHYILKENILRHFNKGGFCCAINLHISMLPWNRGRDPNFWSFIDNTPKGVTIHYIDEGVDTGDIIVQKEVEFSSDDTLKTSYEKLQGAIQQLFKEHWVHIKSASINGSGSGSINKIKQDKAAGTTHKSVDKEPLLYLLSSGWDTQVSVLERYRCRE